MNTLRQATKTTLFNFNSESYDLKNREVKIYKKELQQNDDLGEIIGVAALYNKTCEEDKEGEVRVCVSFLGPNHDYLIRDFDLSCYDDENTQFGFFTNNFYFVDRIIAAELYKKFAAKHNMPLREHLYSLNSYHIDWIRVEKESFRDFLKNMPT